ncbi:hypothetical protein HDU96_004640 [Phlyctochytrium bullatum]|nr:hypothetical protein HDU96_004640 [Phlyctochytrium bullatum]
MGPKKRKAQEESAETESKSEVSKSTTGMHAFFASASSQPAITWEHPESGLLIGRYLSDSNADQKLPSQIAAFDFDSTLVGVKSGKVFSEDENDWKLLVPQVKSKIQELAKTHRIAVLTNQRNLLKEKEKDKPTRGGKLKPSKEKIFKGKAQHFARAVGVPLTILAAVEDDIYRKPRVGMWNKLLELYNLREPGKPGNEAWEVLDKEGSFYCGDAAGRTSVSFGIGDKKKPTKDHSDSDFKFALNAGIKFFLPEELWLEKPEAKHDIPDFSFHPKLLLGLEAISYGKKNDVTTTSSTKVSTNGSATTTTITTTTTTTSTKTTAAYVPLFIPTNYPLVSPAGTQDLVLLVGPPGAGKTFFAHRHLVPHGYLHVNQDRMGTKDKCLKAVRAALAEGKNVVVDNTNPDTKVRGEYIALAKERAAVSGGSSKVTVRAFQLVASLDLCEHNAKYRTLTASGIHATEDLKPVSHTGRDENTDDEGATPTKKKRKISNSSSGVPERRSMIPDIAFRTFTSRFQVPETSEGFFEVKKIRFIPDFETEEERERWSMWH